ncbi:MAG: hypothetical protein HY774_17245 [Acidobacteria bacterium]|nr:hypothetical protein [Acidobacteriota bacterium]
MAWRKGLANKSEGQFRAGGLIPEQAAPLLDRGQMHGDTEMIGVGVSKNMHDRQKRKPNEWF